MKTSPSAQPPTLDSIVEFVIKRYALTCGLPTPILLNEVIEAVAHDTHEMLQHRGVMW